MIQYIQYIFQRKKRRIKKTMNIALIIAGGQGKRMGQYPPKQFLEINSKPIIVYTLETFQKHSQIDVIAVVCLKGWEDNIWEYKQRYGISKLMHVVSGGETGHQSIENGIFKLEEEYSSDSLIIMHEAVRPLVTETIITDCFTVARKYGNAVAAIPSADAVMYTNDGLFSDEIIIRENIRKTQVPQIYKLGEMCNLYREAAARNIFNSATTCTLMAELGKKVFFSNGSSLNFKLTTAEDMELFKAVLQLKK